MRKIKDVLRLKLDARLSHAQISGSLGISKGVIAKYVGLAAAAGRCWQDVQACDDTTLERRLLVALQQPRAHVQPETNGGRPYLRGGMGAPAVDL